MPCVRSGRVRNGESASLPGEERATQRSGASLSDATNLPWEVRVRASREKQRDEGGHDMNTHMYMYMYTET